MDPIVIIGGGPAGSTLACYLAQANIPCTLLERGEHPRAHVGESLVPATVRVLDEIGMLAAMESEGFPRKYGASWHPQRKGQTIDVRFCEVPLEGVNQDYCYHVDRARFDELLFQRASALGARTIENAAVNETCFEGDKAVAVVAKIDGKQVRMPASMVVDASGRGAVLGRQLRLLEKDPTFDQVAVHGWFEGVDRGEGEGRENIQIFFLPVERGWVWLIPITETVTSVGVVAEKSVFQKGKSDLEAYLALHVSSNPNLENAMRSAVATNDLKCESDYSYSMKEFVGDGWALIGDAARFVDPIFSSGVSVALNGARFLSHDIAKAVEKNDFSVASFERYATTVKRGVEIWYDFIKLYYTLMPGFALLMEKPKFRNECIRLLQGDVYDPGRVEVLERFRDLVQQVRSSERHLLKGSLQEVESD